jgi:hypothetical protein
MVLDEQYSVAVVRAGVGVVVAAAAAAAAKTATAEAAKKIATAEAAAAAWERTRTDFKKVFPVNRKQTTSHCRWWLWVDSRASFKLVDLLKGNAVVNKPCVESNELHSTRRVLELTRQSVDDWHDHVCAILRIKKDLKWRTMETRNLLPCLLALWIVSHNEEHLNVSSLDVISNIVDHFLQARLTGTNCKRTCQIRYFRGSDCSWHF